MKFKGIEQKTKAETRAQILLQKTVGKPILAPFPARKAVFLPTAFLFLSSHNRVFSNESSDQIYVISCIKEKKTKTLHMSFLLNAIGLSPPKR